MLFRLIYISLFRGINVKVVPFDIGLERSIKLCVTKSSTHNYALTDSITQKVLDAYKSPSGIA